MLELKANNDLLGELERLSDERLGPILVSRQTLRTALNRFLAHELDGRNLTLWAALIEAYDFIEYEPKSAKVIADILFYISSPEINGQLSPELCRQYLDKLLYSG